MKSGYVLAVKTVTCLRCGKHHQATRVGTRCPECCRLRHCAKAARRRLQDPDKARAELLAWKAANADKVRQHKRDFQDRNRAHRSNYQNMRRAAQLRATPAWADMDAIKGMYELCGVFRTVGLDLHVDHIIPLKGKTVSGMHIADNLQLLHRIDNLRKKNRPEEIHP